MFCQYFEHRQLQSTSLTSNSSLNHQPLDVYRELQVIQSMFNGCMQTWFVPALIFTGSMMQVVCMFATVRLHDRIPMPGFLFFPMMGVDNFITVFFMNDFASGIVMKSEMYLRMWKNSSLIMGKEIKGKKRQIVPMLNKREIKSCGLMKVRFGGANYIDRLTPLVMEDFCINQTLSLILLNNEN
jgi:hypothetical protein